jgi:hypothetical protein
VNAEDHYKNVTLKRRHCDVRIEYGCLLRVTDVDGPKENLSNFVTISTFQCSNGTPHLVSLYHSRPSVVDKARSVAPFLDTIIER